MHTGRKKQIVIVGAGFAGVHAYLELHRQLHGAGSADITLVNPTDYFAFTPLIHEVATGSLLPHNVTQPLRMLPRCCIDQFVLGRATEVDCKRGVVRVRLAGRPGDPQVPGDDFREIPYEYLVLAMGSETNFFDVPGAREHAFELNDVVHARLLKNHVLDRFEHATTLDDPKKQKRELSFVIVGGGPTGVEVAGELSDFVYGVVARSFPELTEHARILIVERGDQLLKRGVGEWFSRRATDILDRKKGVYILYGASVNEVTPDGATTNKGFIDSRTVIWGAGVVARTIALYGEHDVECQDRSCRVRVNDFLQIPGHQNIFVVGDQAWVRDRENDQPYPMRAQFAVREGKLAAGNIVRMMNATPLESFSFKEKGLIISLGKGGALAQIYGIYFSGPLAWFIYRTVYLFFMIGWRTRLRTVLEWTIGLFVPRDISKL